MGHPALFSYLGGGTKLHISYYPPIVARGDKLNILRNRERVVGLLFFAPKNPQPSMPDKSNLPINPLNPGLG
jgi:hypothetical protein